jgi:GNAT superfamily N-acetyltransferase
VVLLMIRSVMPEDVPTLQALICDLAEFEKLRHTVTATEADLHRALFGERPVAEAILAEAEVAGVGSENQAVGFALFFQNYSTFVGKPGLYLEDLYVRPAARGSGVGRALFIEVARRAAERGCGRMEWAALDWNEKAIRFYEGLGARQMSDWRLFRLDAAGLAALTAF